MSNIEHLFENGLALMKKKTPDEWKEQMAKDVNWTDDIGITLDELWLLCQYTVYTYRLGLLEDLGVDLVKVIRCGDCKHIDWDTAEPIISNGIASATCWCDSILQYVRVDGFCDRGDRDTKNRKDETK